MGRMITSHQVGLLNRALHLEAIHPSDGSMLRHYRISTDGSRGQVDIFIHKGPLTEADGKLAKGCRVTGISIEILLAIVEDQLMEHQKGPFACPENQVALDAVTTAMQSLQTRTAERKNRGVEGKIVQ